MKNVINSTIVILTILILSSCSKSGKRHPSKSITKTEFNDFDHAVIKEEPKIITFTPSRVEVTEFQENQHNTLGEGQYPAHTFECDIFFIDSTGAEYSTRLFGKKYLLDGSVQDDGSDLRKVKQVYKTITDALPSDLTITISADRKDIIVSKKEKITKKKAGNAIVRTVARPDLCLWKGSLLL
ncbi:hypothetical protein IT403_00785 [Candidatus Nomurabacteria bacterium]|nr:hypothetical protein [Candidatus Nomurabacteria bacterium]